MIWKKDDYERRKLSESVHRQKLKRRRQRTRKRKQNRQKKLDLNFRKDYEK